MKNVWVINCLIIVTLLSGCEKPDRNQLDERSLHELHTTLSNSEKLQEINDWQKFRRESTESLQLAHEKLDTLQYKITPENTKQMIRLRRDFIAAGYSVEKLQRKILKQGLKFSQNIEHYTREDAIKNLQFRIAFTAKLKALHDQLNDLLKEN